MSRTVIRKNANKKIMELLNSSIGIIARTSSRDVADDYDDHYKIADETDVLKWLKIEKNYEFAKCYIDDQNIFTVEGQYFFDDKFYIYFDSETYATDLMKLVFKDIPIINITTVAANNPIH